MILADVIRSSSSVSSRALDRQWDSQRARVGARPIAWTDLWEGRWLSGVSSFFFFFFFFGLGGRREWEMNSNEWHEMKAPPPKKTGPGIT